MIWLVCAKGYMIGEIEALQPVKECYGVWLGRFIHVDIEITHKKKPSLLQIYGIFHDTGELSTEVDDTCWGYSINYVTMDYSTCKIYVKVAMFHGSIGFWSISDIINDYRVFVYQHKTPPFLFILLGCEQIL